ncbi:MAG: hypothetical protein CMJ23_13990 [Phycisphaerae bacterium]|nr:hypothetical protein [Phycisphaerae bacterium]
MRTLLILGSKPEPALPPPESYTEVACANASGRSAEAHHLPRPVFTAMTPIMATNIEAGRQSLAALTGLSTGTVYFLRERDEGKRGFARLLHRIKTSRKKPFHRMQPSYLKRKLRSISYTHDKMIAIGPEEYDTLVERLCDRNPDVLSQLNRKRPSTGVIALALAIDRKRYDRYILSGFSFELTHSYAINPVIEKRGTPASSHADTDVMVIRHLARKAGNIFTTEKAVHERADVPFCPV